MSDSFGDEIKRLRMERGWTQKDLSRAAGISQPHISHVEAGDRKGTDGDTVNRLCAAFGLPLDYFVKWISPGLTVPPPPHQPAPTLLLPDFGEVPCGPPEIQFSSPPGFAAVSSSQYGQGRFVLHAKGDSMTGRNIQSGDMLIFRQSDTADHGDVVVAWTGAGTTVKVYHRRGEEPNAEHWLYPASEHGRPVRMNAEFRIIGVLKSVVRDVQPEQPTTEPGEEAQEEGEVTNYPEFPDSCVVPQIRKLVLRMI